MLLDPTSVPAVTLCLFQSIDGLNSPRGFSSKDPVALGKSLKFLGLLSAHFRMRRVTSDLLTFHKPSKTCIGKTLVNGKLLHKLGVSYTS